MSKVVDINKNSLLINLNPAQVEGVTSVDGPILVIAGAGSGKTRVLTHRIAYLVKERHVNPSNILAITFTNKAADEMKLRIERLIGAGVSRLMWISTFHSVCVRILRTHIEHLGYKRNFVIYDANDSLRLITHCLRDLGIDTKQHNPRGFAARISNLKNELIGPDEFSEDNLDFFDSMAAKIYKMYQVKLFKNNALDFDDLLFFVVKLFQKAPEVLAAYQDKFQYILVDEYQDTNHAQYKMVALLAAKRRNIFVVGDEDQSIYMWRGADIQNILDFEKDYPEAKIIKLEKNYRSTKKILSAANSVVKNNINRKPKNLWTDNDEGNFITRYQGLNEYEEASFVANEIYTLKEEGYALKDFAVFYRTNAQSRVLEEVFIRYAIPYKVVGGPKFYERKEVKDALAYMRTALNPRDSISLLRIINTPKRGIGAASLSYLEEFAVKDGSSIWDAIEAVETIDKVSPRARKELVEFRRLIHGLQRELEEGTPLPVFAEAVLDSSGMLKQYEMEHTIEAEGRVENLEQFLVGVKEFSAAIENATLDQFLEQVSLIADIDMLNDELDSVTLMTVHNAKGLEFPVVFVAGLEDGLFPHIRNLYETSLLEEERRLCYVGITRAREKLYLTHSASRNIFGSSSYQMASRFLAEIPGELFGETEAEAPREAGASNYDNREVASLKNVSQPRPQHMYSIGQEVKHNKWGNGVVVDLINAEESSNTEIVVNFPDVGEKRLLLAYAPIEPA